MKIMAALYKGFIASAVLSAVLIGGAIILDMASTNDCDF